MVVGPRGGRRGLAASMLKLHDLHDRDMYMFNVHDVAHIPRAARPITYVQYLGSFRPQRSSKGLSCAVDRVMCIKIDRSKSPVV